jgi:hypothetical protein
VRKSNKCELLKEKWKRGKWRENECEKCVPRVLWSYGIFRAETKLRAEGVCVCVRSYSLTLEMNESDEWGLFRHFIERLWCGSEIYLGTHFNLSHCGPLIFLRCSFFFSSLLSWKVSFWWDVLWGNQIDSLYITELKYEHLIIN